MDFPYLKLYFTHACIFSYSNIKICSKRPHKAMYITLKLRTLHLCGAWETAWELKVLPVLKNLSPAWKSDGGGWENVRFSLRQPKVTPRQSLLNINYLIVCNGFCSGNILKQSRLDSEALVDKQRGRRKTLNSKSVRPRASNHIPQRSFQHGNNYSENVTRGKRGICSVTDMHK